MANTNTPTLYSIRMRAAQGGPHEQGGKHISGGERLVQSPDVNQAVLELMDKASNHSRGPFDFLNLIVEEIPWEELKLLPPLPVQTEQVASVEAGRDLALTLVGKCGVSPAAGKLGLQLIQSMGHVRGAVVLDAHTGERLDDRGERGVRVSRLDWRPGSYERWLDQHPGLTNPRTKEALALATKVSAAPGAVAELCWSDDPDYVTGYVAAPHLGYCRITRLKSPGEEHGGRVFFIHRSVDLDTYLTFLEQTPVWIGWED
ncbi:6-carboxyhexanoate--CoA ligase [Caldalkalibacillus uzonensis]|uniref:6-carboxyhexanoate--CoA ligase n=1 Tax=Caldalkalibacillus uzonensis TaxID=353224 RepID=A0ABU0CR61_9BACI|nr:6-carboxyhexanoate--CoA ligase [Caldalkalibacillus uzonensis]MDQ0338371.1 6-carboxyhexanoate--CoA ligase [Caldalkalibacillus uzonensis]